MSNQPTDIILVAIKDNLDASVCKRHHCVKTTIANGSLTVKFTIWYKQSWVGDSQTHHSCSYHSCDIIVADGALHLIINGNSDAFFNKAGWPMRLADPNNTIQTITDHIYNTIRQTEHGRLRESTNVWM